MAFAPPPESPSAPFGNLGLPPLAPPMQSSAGNRPGWQHVQWQTALVALAWVLVGLAVIGAAWGVFVVHRRRRKRRAAAKQLAGGDGLSGADKVREAAGALKCL